MTKNAPSKKIKTEMEYKKNGFDYVVSILGRDFKVESPHGNTARRMAAHLYHTKYGKEYSINSLVAVASVRKLNPRKSGRKPVYGELPKAPLTED